MSEFTSFDDYLAVPRVTDLALAHDGTRLVASIAALSGDGSKWVTSLWDIDPRGVDAARRLTWSEKGETAPVFAPDGSLLFLSARDTDEDDPAALWRLPEVGEANRVLTRPGGVSSMRVARGTGAAVLSTNVLAGSTDADADGERRKARKDATVSAVLHTSTPVRFWDHELGPDEERLVLIATLDGESAPTELTPDPGRALDEAEFAVTPDGSSVLTSWSVLDQPGFPRAKLVAIDTVTGGRRVLAEDPHASFETPAVSHDGRWVVCVRSQDTTYDDPPAVTLWLIELSSGAARALVSDPDVWPTSPAFSADDGAIFFVADELGHRPVFRLDLDSGAITRLTDAGHFASLQVAPDGNSLYALRDALDSPPRPVRLDLGTAGGAVAATVTELPAPGSVTVPGTLEQVQVTATDGVQVHAWLAKPFSASPGSPAPLLLWIHGGPLSSWNGWSWRWNPWLMVTKGYAVLLPDPALSTGYGAQMISRGWGEWGGAPFTDLMTITDAAVARPEIDETKTAAMGASFGGYMANWIAGHTDRFRCIVTHAGLWALDQFQGTTDVPGYWIKEWGLLLERPERYAAWSPHHFLASISTPMLVIHGDKDYRVPVSEALRLWWDLQRDGIESAYLYFPDEGHWILKPGNARVWYETVWSWLGHHIHGDPWNQPALL